MTNRFSCGNALGLLLWTALAVNPAQASPIFNVAPGQCPNNPAVCVATTDTLQTTLFNIFLINPLDDTTGAYANLFAPAFTSWNNSLPVAQRWTLVPSDLSNSARLTVSTYRALAGAGDDNCGNAALGCGEIQIGYTPGAGDPTLIANAAAITSGNAIWSQSIFSTTKIPGALPGNPYLDNASPADRKLNPPAYPYQYDGTGPVPASGFYDNASRPINNSWQGQAFLSTANYTTRTLTVYDGVGWGFYVQAVPEPTTFVLLGLGLVACSIFGQWKRRPNR